MNDILYFFFLLIIMLNIDNGLRIWKINRLENSKISIKKDVIFSLKIGTRSTALSDQLYHEEIISCPQFFRLLLYMKPELAHFKAGTYRFKPGMTMLEILRLFVSGKEAQFSLRFIEGMCLSDYLKQLREAPYIKHTLNDDKYETVAIALNLNDSKWLEGWFWADTWMYTANTTDIALLKRAHQKMVNIVNQIWKERAEGLPYKDQNQLVTMASIIEKETSVIAERSYIASVLINRLNVKMRLQTDPTVIYGMGCNYNSKISREDLKIPTAYNTYTIHGLPPGPIATPGLTSLNAAAHPVKTPYFYFVANGKGGHIFNTNLANHKHSIQEYLKVIRKKNAR